MIFYYIINLFKHTMYHLLDRQAKFSKDDIFEKKDTILRIEKSCFDKNRCYLEFYNDNNVYWMNESYDEKFVVGSMVSFKYQFGENTYSKNIIGEVEFEVEDEL